MKNFLRKTILFLTLSIVMLSLIGCSSAKPDASVKGLLDSIKKLDFNTAQTFIKSDSPQEQFKYDSPEQEKIVKAIFDKISYEIVSTTKEGDTAKVKTKVTSIDMPRTSSKLMSDMMSLILAQSLSDNKVDEAKQTEMITQSFINALNDPNVAKTTTEVDIELVKEGKKWLVVPNDELLDAITGNISKMNLSPNK